MNRTPEGCRIKSFCYVCGQFMRIEGQEGDGHAFTPQFKEWFAAIFPSENLNTTSRYLPKRCCNRCFRGLERWWIHETTFKYIIPMQWPLVDPLEHKREECYGCVDWKQGLTVQKGRDKIYDEVPFEEGMVLPKKPSPLAGNSPALFSVSGASPDVASSWHPTQAAATITSKTPQLLKVEDLDLLVSRFVLPKNHSEYLASFMKHRHLTAPGVNSTRYRTRDAELKKCFKMNAKKTLYTALMSKI